MTRAFWWILLAYIAANVALLAATAEGASLRRGADAQSWYEPTVALYQYGAFVELNDPDKRQTYRGPVFPIFGAAMSCPFSWVKSALHLGRAQAA